MGITRTKTAGMQLSHIGEQLPCTREPGNRKDPFPVASGERSSVTVSQQLQTIDCMSVHVGPHYWFNCMWRQHHQQTERDARMANQNPRSAKIISTNFLKGQSAKILSLKTLALYGIDQ